MTDDDLQQSLDAIHADNTGRPIHCANCGLVFVGDLAAIRYFQHLRQQHRPEPTR